MRQNFSLKFKIGDIFVGVIALVLIVASIITTNVVFASNVSDDEKIVEVYYKGVIIDSLTTSIESISGDEKIIILKQEDYPELLGDFKIIINKQKGIKVDEITCTNHFCERQGWVNYVNMPIVCLPNHVMILMKKDNPEFDLIL